MLPGIDDEPLVMIQKGSWIPDHVGTSVTNAVNGATKFGTYVSVDY